MDATIHPITARQGAPDGASGGASDGAPDGATARRDLMADLLGGLGVDGIAGLVPVETLLDRLEPRQGAGKALPWR